MDYKKIYVLAIFLLTSLHLLAQNKGFKIKGELTNVKQGSKIYIYYYDPKNPKNRKDSAIVQNGKFEFEGKVSSPIKAQLLLLHAPKPAKILLPLHGELDFFNLYLDEGTIKVNGTDSVKNLVITKSKINAEDERLSQIVAVFQKKIDSIRSIYRNAPAEQKKDRAFVDASNAKWDNVNDEIKAAKLQFAKDNPDSYVSLNAIYELAAGRSFDYFQLDTAYQLLSNRYKNTFIAKKTEEFIFTGLNTSVGSPAHDFTQPDANGKEYKLSDFKGKYVQLEFWASWCGPCRKENPNLITAYEKYKDKNFTIVAVSVDVKREAWLKAVEDDKVPYLQLNDMKGPQGSEAALLYRVEGIPASYLIDPNGKIIGKNLRGEELNKKLAELFDTQNEK